MTTMQRLAAMLLLAWFGAAAAEDAPEYWDGLVQVKAKRADAAYLLPGADFRPYTRVMLDRTEVAFQKDWLKRMNDRRDLSRRVTEQDAQEILAAARSNFDDVFADEFTKAGYTVVEAPGADVLRISTAVIDLYVNAPDTLSAGRSRTFTAEAGEATLVLEARDAVSGAIMGRVIDRRETQGALGMQQATRASNTADFRSLFGSWARIAIKGLEELKAQSPVPQDLKPKQKL